MENKFSDSDSHELFVRLLAKHERSIRAYIRGGLPSGQDVAEVMQNVSVIAWRKFSDLESPESNFAKWATVIARYEILKFRRSVSRDRLVLDERLIEKINEEGLVESDAREKQLSTLEFCLNALPETRRELVLKAYATGTSITEMAEQLGKSRDSLYQMLWRIRQELAKCIERKGGVSV